MWKTTHLILLFQVLACLAISSTLAVKRAGAAKNDVVKKDGRVFPLFQVVRFPNTPCNVTESSQRGTCYTDKECKDRKGTSIGACADGFGVCCTFSLKCGGTSQENGTVFSDKNPANGVCMAKVCPLSKDICQLRLDFISFAITGPSSVSDTVGKSTAGQPLPLAIGTQEYTEVGQCLVDSFSVTSPGATAPPVICGTNTNEHMYVDVTSKDCNVLTFNLGGDTSSAAAGSATTTKREWVIRVSQLDCQHPNLAPRGCTKYFFAGSGLTTTATGGTIQTYNFGTHLANQREKFCIRQERNMCRICYFSTAGVNDAFDVSGSKDAPGFTGSKSKCCGYGMPLGGSGYDCLLIPGASKGMGTAAGTNVLKFSEFCGGGNTKLQGGLFTAMTGMTPKTVCSSRLPFMVTFFSDSTELVKESAVPNKGIKLQYVMTACIAKT